MKKKNELIKNIADRYESTYAESCSYSISPSSYEGFAKAIIDECIKSIENRIDYFGPTAVDDIKETIKNHFRE